MLLNQLRSRNHLNPIKKLYIYFNGIALHINQFSFFKEQECLISNTVSENKNTVVIDDSDHNF